MPAKEKILIFLKKPWPWGILIGAILVIYIVNVNLKKDATKVESTSEMTSAPTAGMTPSDVTISNFSLTNQDGAAFGSKDLKDKPYAVSIFFTECPTAECPAKMRLLKKLQDMYDQDKSAVRMVTITVDAHNDRPIDMKEYAEKFGANFKRWIFLTGPKNDVRKVIEGYGLKFAVREKNKEGFYDIAHDAKVVIVDRSGEIKGIYAINEKGIDEIYNKSHGLR